MVTKNKNHTNNQTSVSTQIISHIGLVVMLAAAVVNMAELAEREGNRVIGSLQPHYSFAAQPIDGSGPEQRGEHSRSAKEEIPHSSINVGAARRTPSVTGSL